MSFRFLNSYIGQPSQPVCVKLPSSSCFEPWPHPGKGTLPMPDQAGKLSSERNGGYTRPKGPFHPDEGQGVNCPLSGPSGSGPAWEEKLFQQGKQCSCTVCLPISAELVPSSLFVQCCTLYNLTGFLAWLQSGQIHLYLSWILQNVVFNETSSFQNLLG